QSLHLGLACVDRRLHGGDVALDKDRDVTTAQLFAGQHFHRGGFQGGVDGLKYSGEALGFDQTDGEGRLGFVFHSVLRILHGGLFEEGVEIGGSLVGRLAGGRGRRDHVGDHRDLHGTGGGFGGGGRRFDVAQGAVQLEAHAGAIVEFGLQHTHTGHL